VGQTFHQSHTCWAPAAGWAGQVARRGCVPGGLGYGQGQGGAGDPAQVVPRAAFFNPQGAPGP